MLLWLRHVVSCDLGISSMSKHQKAYKNRLIPRALQQKNQHSHYSSMSCWARFPFYYNGFLFRFWMQKWRNNPCGWMGLKRIKGQTRSGVFSAKTRIRAFEPSPSQRFPLLQQIFRSPRLFWSTSAISCGCKRPSHVMGRTAWKNDWRGLKEAKRRRIKGWEGRIWGGRKRDNAKPTHKALKAFSRSA